MSVSRRRLLGGGTLGPLTPAGYGVAGVTFLTGYRLAELLGAPVAAERRRPVSTPVLAAAVEACSRDRDASAVAQHPATEQALVDAYRELSQCDDLALDRLAHAGRRATDVVRVYRAARAALAGEWYDERDLMDTAVAAVGEGSPVLADLGAIVLYLPQDLSLPGADAALNRRPRAAHGRGGRHRRRTSRCGIVHAIARPASSSRRPFRRRRGRPAPRHRGGLGVRSRRRGAPRSGS